MLMTRGPKNLLLLHSHSKSSCFQPIVNKVSDEITHKLQGIRAAVRSGWPSLRVQGGLVRLGSLGRVAGIQKGVPAAGLC